MTPTGSRPILKSRIWQAFALILCISCCAAIIWNVWRLHSDLQSVTQSGFSSSSAKPDLSPVAAPEGVLTDLSLSTLTQGLESEGALDIRLVGTFFEYAEIGTNCIRHAVLADLNGQQQEIVPEGGSFLAYGLVRIERDMVTVERRADRSRHILRLASPDETRPQTDLAQGQTSTAGGVSRPMSFGGQIASNHWVLSRQGLLDYYQELRDNPDRLLKVFDTMKPLRDEAGKITGYTVGIEGEKGFFDSVGLQEGDVVRKTNGRPMTNRRLAERFIAGFVKGDNNAFVLEIERGGTTEKLTFQIR